MTNATVARPSLKVPHYSGWRPRSMRRGYVERKSNNAGAGANSRDSKRNRVLGNRRNRAIYKHAHGYKHKDYASLCRRVDAAHGR